MGFNSGFKGLNEHKGVLSLKVEPRTTECTKEKKKKIEINKIGKQQNGDL